MERANQVLFLGGLPVLLMLLLCGAPPVAESRNKRRGGGGDSGRGHTRITAHSTASSEARVRDLVLQRAADTRAADVGALISQALVEIEASLVLSPESFALRFYGVRALEWRGVATVVHGGAAAAAALQGTYCAEARGDGMTGVAKFPASELRYFYTVCCEAARRSDAGGELGRRRACYSEAEQRKIWNVPFQYPVQLTNGLRAAPLWSLAELPQSVANWLASMQSQWPEIRLEALAAGGYAVEQERLHEYGEWAEYLLWDEGRPQAEHCAVAPLACAATSELVGRSSGRGEFQAKFSRLKVIMLPLLLLSK